MPEEEQQQQRPPATVFRLVLLGVLVVMLVAATATALVLHSRRTGAADTLQADREAAMAQTQQFVMRVNTYGPSMLDSQGRMPSYRKQVQAVITPKFSVSFDKSVPVAEKTVKDYRLQRSCAVYATGVQSIDADTAQVLVAGSMTQSAPNRHGKRVQVGDPVPFRLLVSLDKIDGTWLVDDYQAVKS